MDGLVSSVCTFSSFRPIRRFFSFGAISVEKSTLTFFIFLFFNSVRMTFARGHTLVFAISAI